MQIIYIQFFEYVCVELWFVFECSKMVRYIEYSVSFLNQYANCFPFNYRQSGVEDIFYEFSLFSHSVLVLLIAA